MRHDLLLLPGLLNDFDLWRDQVAGLADIANCHVADISRSGTLRDVALDVLASAPPFFALAGFSLGGYVAQEVLRIAPERVARLALLDTSIRADTPARAAQRRALDQAAQAPGRFHGFGEHMLEAYVDRSRLGDADLLCRIRAMTERLGVEVFLRQNRLERKDGAEVLRCLRIPTLVLCGANDQLTPPSAHREMAALAEGAALVIVPDTGHLTPMEAPDAVTRALRDWLSDPS